MAEVKKQTKKIAVVGDQLLSLGLKLAGVKETYPTTTVDEAEKVMLKLFDREDIGIIVISEGISDSIKDRRIRYKIDNSLSPIVIDIPGYLEAEKHADTLRRLILRAVGIELVNTKQK